MVIPRPVVISLAVPQNWAQWQKQAKISKNTQN